MPTTIRNYTGVYYILQYNGTLSKNLKGLSGLRLTSQVADDNNGKKIISVDTECIQLYMPFDKSPDRFLQNIIDGLVTFPASIYVLDAQLNSTKIFDLGICKVVELEFPSLDASSKDSAHVILSLKPQYIHVQKAVYKMSVTGNKLVAVRSNFSLEINNIDTRRVSKISGLKIIPQFNTTSGKFIGMNYNSVFITMAESEINKPDWQNWIDEFIAEKQNGSLDGFLKFLGPDLRTIIFEMHLRDIYLVSATFNDLSGNVPGTVTNERAIKTTLEIIFNQE